MIGNDVWFFSKAYWAVIVMFCALAWILDEVLDDFDYTNALIIAALLTNIRAVRQSSAALGEIYDQ